METYSKLLLTLYRTAREVPADEFPDRALGMLTPLLRFDSARLVTVEMMAKGAVVHGTHLYREPVDMVLDWEEINRHDTVLDTVSAQPGSAINIHAPTYYAASIMRDYVQKYAHQNSLVIAEFDASCGYYHGLSLWRADKDNLYAEDERKMMEYVAPHLIEAFSINHLLSSQSTGEDGDSAERGVTALARIDGMIHHCEHRFVAMLRREWPEWRGIVLPQLLLDALAKVGATGYTGRFVSISAMRVGEMLMLRAIKASVLSRLSNRELEVARRYGEGHSYKEIARDLNIAPVTVRNFLQRIYQKLQIRDKAALAAILIRRDSR